MQKEKRDIYAPGGGAGQKLVEMTLMPPVCFYIGNTADSLYPLDPVGFDTEGRLCATSSVFTTFAHDIHSTVWFSVRCAPPCTTFGFEAKGNSREHVGSSHRFVVHSYSAYSWKSR